MIGRFAVLAGTAVGVVLMSVAGVGQANGSRAAGFAAFSPNDFEVSGLRIENLADSKSARTSIFDYGPMVGKDFYRDVRIVNCTLVRDGVRTFIPCENVNEPR